MKLEVKDARPYHCGQIARILRAEHRSAILAIGLDPHRELRTCFDASCHRRAWFLDGRLVAVFGVTGPRIASTGFIWLALSEEATKYPVKLVREAIREIREVMITKRVLTTTIQTQDEAAVRFARFLGFERADEVLPIGEGEADEYWLEAA